MKYTMTTTLRRLPKFAGDNRDQRALLRWSAFWMADVLAVSRDGAALVCFIDWRNLPVIIDAVQVAGWVFRGILPWDKTEQAKPDVGWFRAQCEYCVLATAGPIDRGPGVAGVAMPGVLRHRVDIQNKRHATEKPVPLFRDIIRTRDDWQTILDPFMGSGNSLLAARQLGRTAIGMDIDKENCRTAAEGLKQRILGYAG